ncbi:mitochondrial 54S ribosomal bL33m domain-containing protein [Aspergillus affinis]|uniref:mitochondrial 54S ribosomal bL33m domain-containing protein n=1 Tax=Aspergillus affinis TaxID=1070780 RepID=UPI0022FEC060|nr:uncharacterized protein KD926_008683 [Aspergillus affinis]KAI9039992.1 hypothetical protein KD926_008683 [Aspergillus affinis]
MTSGNLLPEVPLDAKPSHAGQPSHVPSCRPRPSFSAGSARRQRSILGSNDFHPSTPPSSSPRPLVQAIIMAKKGKSRTLPVRLISMAMTGYFRTMIRPRTHRPLSMLKYDPVVKKKVLFLEATKGGRNR